MKLKILRCHLFTGLQNGLTTLTNMASAINYLTAVLECSSMTQLG